MFSGAARSYVADNCTSCSQQSVRTCSYTVQNETNFKAQWRIQRSQTTWAHQVHLWHPVQPCEPWQARSQITQPEGSIVTSIASKNKHIPAFFCTSETSSTPKPEKERMTWWPVSFPCHGCSFPRCKMNQKQTMLNTQMKARWLSCKNCFLRPNDLKWWESAELFTLIPHLSVGVAREWTASRLKIAHYEQNTGEFNEFDEFKASLGFAMSGMTDLCILSMNTAKTHTNHTLTWHHSVKEPQQTAAILTRPGLEPWRQVLQVHRGSTPSLFGVLEKMNENAPFTIVS